MTALVSVETILLALMAVLVAGLLRSHAEILRRLEDLDQGTARAAPRTSGLEELPEAREVTTPAFDFTGTTLDGDAVKISVTGQESDTLLAFLSSGCLGCQPFWDGLAPSVRPRMPGGARIVVVTKDPGYERPSRLRELAPADLPVVMSSAAWDAYAVRGSPYFIHADGGGVVRGEGTATNWHQVASLFRDALEDRVSASRDSSPERLRRADLELRAAGIGPGHPSLHARPDRAEGSKGAGP